MEIMDTYGAILALAQNTNSCFDENAWRAYAEAVDEGLAQKCLKDSAGYDFEHEVRPVIEATLMSKEKLEKAHSSFVAATTGLRERLEQAFGMTFPVKIILYLGLCNGAGWATSLNGKPAVLLGMEKIIELDWVDNDSMTALLYHELGHIWHDAVGTYRRDTATAAEKALWQLYREGVAMYCEQLLSDNFSYGRRDKNGWRSWCEENRKELFADYKKRVDGNESTQDFFGDWSSYLGFSDVGYYLGCELIKNMSQRYSLAELAKLDTADIAEELRKLAE